MIEYVIKRDGRKEPFEVSKIRQQIEFACKDTDISPLELESNLQITKKSITTSDIQEILLSTAIKLTSVENPDMVLVAGRLSMWQLYRQIYKAIKIDITQFSEFMSTYAKRNKLYNFDFIRKFSDADIKQLEQVINEYQKLDFNKTIAQVESLKAKYLLKNKGKIVEYPIWVDMINAMILASKYDNYLDKTKQYFKMLVNNVISLATPFKRNLRVPNGNTGSCFILPVADNWEGIAKAITDAGIISREGGGLGVYVTPIRPQGSRSERIPSAGNIMNWVRFFNDIANSVTQASANRKGALTVGIDWWHMDSNDFVEMKTETGGELRLKAFDLFPQVIIDDVFVEAVLNDDYVYQFDHYEANKLLDKDIPYLIDEDFKLVYNEIVELISKNKLKHFRKIKAKDLWKRYLEIWIETGDFYIIHKGNINIDNKHKDIGIAASSNLCVVGDTKILTKEYGYKEIVDLEGQNVNIWNGSEWSETTIIKTSEGQKVIKIETTGGVVECTPYHKFYVVKNYTGKIEEKRAWELNVGDKLIKFDLPIIDGYKELNLAYENGFFSGDGYQEQKAKRIYLYHNKMSLIELFNGYRNSSIEEKQKRIVLTYSDDALKDKFFVPDSSYTIQSRLKWFAGLLDSDGALTKNIETQSFQIGNINYRFLHEVLMMLQTLGVTAKLTKNRDAGYRPMPKNNGTGEYKDYCQTGYRLLIGESGVQTLLNLGLKTHRLQPKLRQPNRNAECFIQVTGIIDEDKIEPTWCFTEPKRHLGMFNGLCTGQCVESFSLISPATEYKLEVVNGKVKNYDSNGLYHSCSLISINVSNIDKYNIREVTKCAVEMLDNSIDLGKMPVPEAKNSSELFRNIGIGILGLADYLAKNNIIYNTDKGYIESEKLMELISYNTYKASMEIAKEYESYPAFKFVSKLFGKTPQELNDASLNHLDWGRLIDDINDYGLRNGWLLAIAPNTSTGLLMGVTASYLPTQEKFFYQKLGGMNVPVLPPFIKTNYWSYKPKHQIPAEDIVKMTRHLQRWVDTGISMELFINPEITNIKKISDNILDGFKNKELKAVYYSLTIDGKKVGCTDCAN